MTHHLAGLGKGKVYLKRVLKIDCRRWAQAPFCRSGLLGLVFSYNNQQSELDLINIIYHSDNPDYTQILCEVNTNRNRQASRRRIHKQVFVISVQYTRKRRRCQHLSFQSGLSFTGALSNLSYSSAATSGRKPRCPRRVTKRYRIPLDAP